MKTETKGYWHNHETNDYDYRDMPQTEKEWRPYMSPPVFGLLRCYVSLGLCLEHAALNALSTACGEPIPYPVDKEATQ